MAAVAAFSNSKDYNAYKQFVNHYDSLLSLCKHLKTELCNYVLPKDMPSVEFFQKHLDYKNKLEMVEEDFRQTAKLGQHLLKLFSGPASPTADEVREKMVILANERTSLCVIWKERQRFYEQCKDLQRFYREIEEANTWIDQQQASLAAAEDDEMDIDSLIKRQEELENALAEQDEKIKALDELAAKLLDGLKNYSPSVH